jgi:hypothetical protein
MMQDALAIVSFPSRIVPWTEDPIRLALINNWREGQFADPFKNHDYVTMNSLDKFYSHLSTFIEDYITKATSEFP